VRFSQANCRDQDILASASAGTDYRLMTKDGYLPAMFCYIIHSSLAYSEHNISDSLPVQYIIILAYPRRVCNAVIGRIIF
ncbi:MAG: hypothetical protein ABRQ23_08630, partial [Syntrophomonadaceae bacterium]